MGGLNINKNTFLTHKNMALAGAILFLFLVIFTLARGETYSLDVCGPTSITEQGQGGNAEWIYGNDCIQIIMRKNQYNPNIDISDLYNDRTFQLHLFGIDERDFLGNETSYPFASMSLNSDTSNGYLEYKNSDISIGYIITGNKIKTVATLTNLQQTYGISEYWLKVKYHKNEEDVVDWIPVIVDSVEQALVLENRTAGQNIFYYQKLGFGNVYEIDPVYVVDYSPIPAEHLITGFVDEPDFDYVTIVDITAGISDSSDATAYLTIKNNLTINEDIASVFKFEETSGNITKDYGIFGTDMILYNGVDLSSGGASGSGLDFDGVDDYGLINRYANLSAIEDIVVCIAVRDTGIGSAETIYDNKGGGGDQGIELVLLGNDEFDFFIRRGGTQTTLQTMTALDDSTWHTICSVSLANGTVEIYVDNTSENSGTGITGAVVPTQIIHIGESHTGGNRYSQRLDELCTWRGINLSYREIISEYETDYCGNPDGNHISGNWNQTYDISKDWYLRIRKTSVGDTSADVFAYETQDNVSNQYTTTSLIGTGWFNIPVDSLMDYMTNTINLSYTKIKFTTYDTHNISEIYLRSESNDTTNPSITDCQVNTTTLNCLETAMLKCNVTDDADVQNVTYTVNNVNYTAIMNFDFWEYIYSPVDVNGSVVYDWEYAIAKDLAGNTNITDPNLQINYTCDFEDYINITHYGINGTDQFNITSSQAVIYWTTSHDSDSRIDYGNVSGVYTDFEFDSSKVTQHYLTLTGLNILTTYYYSVTSKTNPNQTLAEFNFTTFDGCENWVADPINCRINDTYILTYTDTNACGTTFDLPLNNGTEQSCNYCSEDLSQILGICQINATQTVDWVDSNYTSCCLVTGLPSDCSILTYPFNSTTSQGCSYFNNTMGNITCQNEPDFSIREKEYCLAYIPIQFLNETFKCISHITKLATNEIMQTNPEYRENKASFVGFLARDPETREYFTPANSIVNFYYTQKNMLPETDYVLAIECSSQQRMLSSSRIFQMGYESFEFVFFRGRWLIENAGYIIAGLIIILILLILAWLVYRGSIGF